jgi:hypothetical protein
MSNNLFQDLGLSENIINSNIDLYYLNKINNGNKKLIASYNGSFQLDNSNNCRFFKIDPYNLNRFVAWGDSWTSGNSACAVGNCWANTLATSLNMNHYNNAVSGTGANYPLSDSAILTLVNNNNLYTQLSSIILYGLNDYRSSYTLYQSLRGWEYTKCIADFYAFCSIPRVSGCFVPARSMNVISGTWLTTSSISPWSFYTNSVGASLSYTFTNKRYVYISFYFGPSTKVNAKWDIYINNVLSACEYQTNCPSLNRSGTQIYSSGLFIDTGSNNNITLRINYMGTGGIEYNEINYICCYNDDDVSAYGRHCLVLSIPKMGASYSVSTNFAEATEPKRLSLIDCQMDAVRTCQRMGLNVFHMKGPSVLPMSDDNLHPYQQGEDVIAKSILKYININQLSS